MKTNLLKSLVLAASALGAMSSASAETLHASIPFGFSAAGTTMPAGAYSISKIPNTPSVLLFENEATKMQTLVFVRIAAAGSAKPAQPLTFAATGNESMELAHIAADGWGYELSVRPAGALPKGVALTLTSSGR